MAFLQVGCEFHQNYMGYPETKSGGSVPNNFTRHQMPNFCFLVNLDGTV